MVNRTRIRVGYDVPYESLYYGVDVMLMEFDVEMIPVNVYLRGTSAIYAVQIYYILVVPNLFA